ncbi:MAG: hypothetical protein II994_00190 [Lachnospiraceae bacterium]|nr:hypothetical protein [Lachnospiraceae bacterium]
MKSEKQNNSKKKINFENSTIADRILLSILMIIGLAEVIHLVAVMLDKSLSFCMKLFVPGFFLVIAVVGVVGFFERRANASRKNADGGRKGPFQISVPTFTAGLLMILQVVMVLMQESVYIDGDMTLETVNTFLATDAVYQVNPLTGAPYEMGMPFRLKILCLPTLYSMLASVLQVSTEYLVYHLVPAVVLLCSYLVYWNLGGILFGTEAKDSKKRECFMILVVLMFWVGSYAYGMDGFGALFCGYRGVSVRALILLPYTFSLILRKKWITACLCVLAEACIVWTFYGMGACLFVLVFLWLTERLLQAWDKRKTGKGDATC